MGAYWQGRDARAAGVPRAECPCVGVRGLLWRIGWTREHRAIERDPYLVP